MTNHHSYHLHLFPTHGTQRDSLKIYWENVLHVISFSGFSPHSKKKKKTSLSPLPLLHSDIPPVSLLKSTDICCFGNRLNTLKFSSPNIQETWLSSLRSLYWKVTCWRVVPNHLFTILLLSCISSKANRWLYIISPNGNIWPSDLLVTDHLLLDFSVIRAISILLTTFWHEVVFVLFCFQFATK